MSLMHDDWNRIQVHVVVAVTRLITHSLVIEELCAHCSTMYESMKTVGMECVPDDCDAKD
jgi:hypothetical protein